MLNAFGNDSVDTVLTFSDVIVDELCGLFKTAEIPNFYKVCCRGLLYVHKFIKPHLDRKRAEKT